LGEGPADARVMMVGEQPGHEEDLAGHPFVGPAGRLLDRALAAAGIARDEVYVTNAVKHFKWEPRGKRRIHAKPSQMEIAACMPWLSAPRAPRVLATVHPSSILRAPDEKARQREFDVLVADLAVVRAVLR
jgi:uracil-DNA glycosylase